jgi:hypothetical protein
MMKKDAVSLGATRSMGQRSPVEGIVFVEIVTPIERKNVSNV